MLKVFFGIKDSCIRGCMNLEQSQPVSAKIFSADGFKESTRYLHFSMHDLSY